jgi:nicotinamidase-related amidase
MPYRRPLTLDPAKSALVIVECQNGVVGKDSVLPGLASEVGPMLVSVGKLAEAARSAGVFIVHATFQTLADNRSAVANNPLFGMVLKHTATWTAGSDPVQVAPEIGVGPKDLVMPRHHGLSPTQGTELLSVLRNLGVDTVIVSGVSLNVAIPTVSIDAVNEGFRVVVPTDGVAGSPAEYAKLVLKHTVAMVATLATCEEIATAWGSPP